MNETYDQSGSDLGVGRVDQNKTDLPKMESSSRAEDSKERLAIFFLIVADFVWLQI